MIKSETVPTISTPRLSLRWLTADDAGALYTIFSDPEVMRYWSTPPLTDPREARAMIDEIHEHFRRRDLFKWGVARREDDLVIGTCTLAHIDPQNRRAEIGYALAREHWGRGYIREALMALIDFAFESLNLHRIEADVDPRNAASVRVLEHFGFQREGYMRERWLVGGGVYDSIFYGLLRSEWRR